MIAAALTGLVIAAIVALCWVAKLENQRDDRAEPSNVPAVPGTTTSDPGRWQPLPVTTAPCATAHHSVKGDSPGSEACEPCTVLGCGPGCKCACHWGTTATRAWATLTSVPGWGDHDGWFDLDAEAFATDDLLTRAGQILGAAV